MLNHLPSYLLSEYRSSESPEPRYVLFLLLFCYSVARIGVEKSPKWCIALGQNKFIKITHLNCCDLLEKVFLEKNWEAISLYSGLLGHPISKSQN